MKSKRQSHSVYHERIWTWLPRKCLAGPSAGHTPAPQRTSSVADPHLEWQHELLGPDAETLMGMSEVETDHLLLKFPGLLNQGFSILNFFSLHIPESLPLDPSLPPFSKHRNRVYHLKTTTEFPIIFTGDGYRMFSVFLYTPNVSWGCSLILTLPWTPPCSSNCLNIIYSMTLQTSSF